MTRPAFAPAALLFALAACNAPGPRDESAPPLPYLEARGADLLDVFEFDVGAGTGLFAAAAVEPVRVGYGWYASRKLGLMGRAVGSWREERRELFVGLHDLLRWRKEPAFGNGWLFTPDEIHRSSADPGADETGFHRAFYKEWGWTTRIEDIERPWLDVNAELHLFFVGIDVGFSPQELADFLFGWFGVDAISQDDRRAAPEDVVEPVADESGDRT